MYRVRWEVDVDAETPQEAAKKCQGYMDAGDTNWVFDVYEVRKNSLLGKLVVIDMADQNEEDGSTDK